MIGSWPPKEFTVIVIATWQNITTTKNNLTRPFQHPRFVGHHCLDIVLLKCFWKLVFLFFQCCFRIQKLMLRRLRPWQVTSDKSVMTVAIPTAFCYLTAGWRIQFSTVTGFFELILAQAQWVPSGEPVSQGTAFILYIYICNIHIYIYKQYTYTHSIHNITFYWLIVLAHYDKNNERYGMRRSDEDEMTGDEMIWDDMRWRWDEVRWRWDEDEDEEEDEMKDEGRRMKDEGWR